MAKETDGRGRATMNEADIEYLRNINTRPGPNAGRSIDPTKPGPDDDLLPREHQDPSKWPTRETVERAHALTQSDAADRREEELREDERLGAALRRAQDAEDRLAALAQSDAEPVAFNKTEQNLLPGLRRAAYILQQYWEPNAIVPAFDDVQNEIKRIEALAQSDAEPDDDKPLGFRTNDVPDPYAEGPQSDAEPSLDEDAVNAAFDKWVESRAHNPNGRPAFHAGVEFGLRHTRPPRPDASAGLVEVGDISEQVWQALCARAAASAGLIEAAAMAEECASECLEDRKAPLSAYALRDFAKLLRTSAADRSRK